MILDLHGLNEQEAYASIYTNLLTLDMDPFEQHLDIITGKGLGILKRITLDILDEDYRQYQIINEIIRVYKKSKEENEFSEIEDLLLEYKKLF